MPPQKDLVLATLRDRLRFALAWDVARARFVWLSRVRGKALRRYERPDAAGLDYSQAWLKEYEPQPRLFWTLLLLASIPDLDKRSLLIVGPRFETEILLSRALGFQADGIRGLDTFSYSPLIDVGDMHAMPYGDGSFANVLCPWTISYSKRPADAASELARVLAPSGYLVLGVEHTPEDWVDSGEIVGVLTGDERVQTPEAFDRLFPDLERVAAFRPADSQTYGQTLVAYRKPRTS